MKKIRKNNVNKGFTLVELLSVIAILAVIISISVPVYNTVKKETLEKQYKNVITTIENAAEKYAKEKHITRVIVEDLINEGYISADDQEKINNPINKKSLNCYVVTSKYENGVYISSFKEDENLSDKDGKCKNYIKATAFEICTDKNDGNGCQIFSDNSWFKEDLTLGVKLPLNMDANFVKYEWTSTVGDTGSNSTLIVNTDSIKKVTYTVNITYNKGEENVSGSTSKIINIDKQKPTADIEITNEKVWSLNKTIKVKGIDGIGSGIKGYILLNDAIASCPTEIERYKTDVNQTVNVTDNGNYKVCIMDKIGNINGITGGKLNITFIDKNDPVLNIKDARGEYIISKTLNFDVSDAEGLGYYKIMGSDNNEIVNKSLNNVKSLSESYTFSNDGKYTITLCDTAGRCTKDRTIIVDSLMPSLIPERSSIGSNSINAVWNKVNLEQYFYFSTSDSLPLKGSMDKLNSYSPSCGSNYYGFVYAIDKSGRQTDVIRIPNSYYYSCPSYDYDWGGSTGGGVTVCDDACRLNQLSKEINDAKAEKNKADQIKAEQEAEEIRKRNEWEISHNKPGDHTVDKNGNCITWC